MTKTRESAMSAVMEMVRRHLKTVPPTKAVTGDPLPNAEEVEEVVSSILYVWERISHTDLQLHDHWMKDESNYDAEYAKMESLYKDWAHLATDWLGQLDWLAGKGVVISGTERLREASGEARGILTPDNEFFAGPELGQLVDEALIDHREGRTEPFLNGAHA